MYTPSRYAVLLRLRAYSYQTFAFESRTKASKRYRTRNLTRVR